MGPIDTLGGLVSLGLVVGLRQVWTGERQARAEHRGSDRQAVLGTPNDLPQTHPCARPAGRHISAFDRVRRPVEFFSFRPIPLRIARA